MRVLALERPAGRRRIAHLLTLRGSLARRGRAFVPPLIRFRLSWRKRVSHLRGSLVRFEAHAHTCAGAACGTQANRPPAAAARQPRAPRARVRGPDQAFPKYDKRLHPASEALPRGERLLRARCVGGRIEGIEAVSGRELEKLSHASPGR
jgi:hypothetical protein